MNSGKRWLFPGALWVSFGFLNALAQSTTYTRCEVPKSSTVVWEDKSATSRWCLPPVNNSPNPETISIWRTQGSQLVLSIPAQNCQNATTSMRGAFSLVVDSSDSMNTTDPQNLRLNAVKTIVSKINTDITAENPSPMPQVSGVSYGGRQGEFEAAYEADGLNRVFKPQECEATTYNAPGWDTKWKETIGSSYISRCEFMTKQNASTANTGSFLAESGVRPRGATDLTYYLKALVKPNMVADSGVTSRNVLVVTDGLPNIPKRVAGALCRTLPHLALEPILKDERGLEYCISRQFRYAASLANTYLESTATYKTINLYNVLFMGNGKAVIDVDEKGKLNPADFLIENSARTGNGSVKFFYAKSQKDLENYATKVLTYTSDNALQRVSISVNGGTAYNAVSPGAFNQFFTIKAYGLNTGSNTVVATLYYTNTTVTKTYTVNVTDVPAGNVGNTNPSDFICGSASSTLTVDGDNPASKTPKGDGFLPPNFPTPYPDNVGESPARVFRNADPANNLNPNDFIEVSTKDFSKDPRNNRLQGGTGNCGVVAQGAGPSGHPLGLALLGLPLVVTALRGFSRKTRRGQKGR